MAEPRRKAGRPPVQHIKHVHVIALSPGLEEKIDTVTERFVMGKGLRAVGEAVKGLLSHPAGLILVAGVWISIFITLRPQEAGVDVDKEGTIIGINRFIFMSYAQNIMGPIMAVQGVSQEDTNVALTRLFDIWEGRIGKPLRGFLGGLLGGLF